MTLPEVLQAYARALHCRHVGKCLRWSVVNAHNDNAFHNVGGDLTDRQGTLSSQHNQRDNP